MRTVAPLFASSNAIPAPMPRDAPVTTATLPERGRVYSCGVAVADILRATILLLWKKPLFQNIE